MDTLKGTVQNMAEEGVEKVKDLIGLDDDDGANKIEQINYYR
jgi:hypothetical protein